MLKFRTVNILFGVVLVILIIADRSFDIPSIWYWIVVALYLGIVTYGTAVLSAQFFLPVKYKGDKASNSVALTFDDGPIAGKTDEILRILHSHGVHAAFFCIGNRVESNPELMKRIFESGHLIGNHSYWHRATFDLQSGASIGKELVETDHAIFKTIGAKPAFFRPPYGVTNPMVAAAVKRGGYKTIGWSVRSFDTVIKDSKVLMERITRSLKGGDVILLHDYSNTTLEILPALLDHIKKVGLKIVRVDQLLNEKAYV
jgi:peptidoglycan/xylan/chitin deacetylase (PgdA/CDA1 family)